ncbi:CaiB/BaiF CoA transferase family protein [Candidatus Viadribacter manganicus]|uniref:CoA-transferase n=1 Tax=Candidatus Viadribacter manganicus TaxID=1759059 RepID=A0A1B1ADG0_9PROT|nr:CaiB/BaiF CoA-transferase family protein [Candidatus Viadribacter manganicus]ANP44595.1 CoA-transferase [Candidatus Viadribacter manganicus]
MSETKASLAGVRVLDLSRVLAGPWATQILGDFGADVIKIERPGAGDDTRSWGPPFIQNGEGDAAYFLSANRNKKSVAIDFAKSEGAELLRKLAPQCQIVVENFRPGGLKKYGLDYASLSAINPSIVYCSITGFGQTGPYAKRPGYDYIIQGMGGLMSLTGEINGEPMKSAVAVADLFTGMYAVSSILAALRHAERTGEGQHLDLSLLDCQIAMLANLGASYLTSGQKPQRFGNQHAAIAPYQVFATADGHIILAIGNDGQFRDFCDCASSDLCNDPRFATNEARVVHREALTAALSSIMSTRTTSAWVKSLEAADVPCGPINTLDQVFADPHVIARGAVETATRADGTAMQLAVNPVRMSETPPATRFAPPSLGNDTDGVLRQLLAITDAELTALRNVGAI